MKRLFNRLSNNKKALLVLAVCSAVSTPVSADMIYATGFESPEFALQTINGQDGWSGNAMVQDELASSGTQALHLDASESYTEASANLDIATENSILTVEMNYLQTAATTQAGLFLVGDTGFLAQIAIIGSGSVLLGNTNSNTPLQDFALNVWHSFRIELDFVQQTMFGYVDGLPLGLLEINTFPLPTVLTRAGVYSFGTGGSAQDIYADNFAVSSLTVPEPPVITLLVLGFAGIMINRRRKNA